MVECGTFLRMLGVTRVNVWPTTAEWFPQLVKAMTRSLFCHLLTRRVACCHVPQPPMGTLAVGAVSVTCEATGRSPGAALVKSMTRVAA